AEIAALPIQGEGKGVTLGTHGGGARVVSTTQEFAAGPLQPTRSPLDLAIDGNGFFEIEDLNGNRFYTRSGRFRLDDQGYMSATNG
ncbi:flagellar hook-basal body complex protein, partial [Bacillus sp. SIMBA_008]|uniref:flagellar hook-basal body complex protein n=1 Tax=Bacillus sp. SIMBA_008 TaxID=3085757 RepID=UPI00397A09D8